MSKRAGSTVPKPIFIALVIALLRLIDDSRRNWGMNCSPAILGSFVALERRGGSEDPWLCATSFGWFCLYRKRNYEPEQ
jgi:hypothetical protein